MAYVLSAVLGKEGCCFTLRFKLQSLQSEHFFESNLLLFKFNLFTKNLLYKPCSRASHVIASNSEDGFAGSDSWRVGASVSLSGLVTLPVAGHEPGRSNPLGLFPTAGL